LNTSSLPSLLSLPSFNPTKNSLKATSTGCRRPQRRVADRRTTASCGHGCG
jgi:hypothetical protein